MAAKPKPRTFTKVIDGETAVQVAHTPAEAVRLKFGGWIEQTEEPTAAAASPAKPKAKPSARSDAKTDK